MKLRLMFLMLMWTPPVSSVVSCVVMETCLLPCYFTPGHLQLIEWVKRKGNALVHLFQNGRETLDRQDPSFRGRTSSFPEQYRTGNGSIQLSAVTVDDEGHYRCFVATEPPYTGEWIRVTVESPVKTLSMELKGDVLVCSSESIYPQPNVSWTPQSEQKPQLEPSKEKLYSITSSFTVDLHPPQKYSCNISTDHSWKSATYSLQSPVQMSTNITIPCVTSMVPEKSLVWTFNYIQTIVTRRGAEVMDTAPWRSHVERVSKSGSLSLKNLNEEHQGVYECKLHTDDISYISRTVVGQTPPKPEDGVSVAGVIVAVLVLLFIVVFVVVLLLWRKRQLKQRDETDGEAGIPLIPKGKDTTILKNILKEMFENMSEAELQEFKRHLMDQTLMEGFKIIDNDLETEDITEALIKPYGVRSITVTKKVIQKMEKDTLLEKLTKRNYDPEEIIKKCKNKMKSELTQRFQFLSEGVGDTKMDFNEGYTELFITEGGSGEVNQEHEVRQMEAHSRGSAQEHEVRQMEAHSRGSAQEHEVRQMEAHSRRSAQETTVLYQDLFKGHTQTGQPIRAVLTKGVTGVGKTVLTQKLSLDWAEGTVHQDVELVLPFTFRELNKFIGSQCSLDDLLHHCFSQTKGLCSLQHIKVLFIFDGLDECRPSLNFNQTQVLTDPTQRASVEELLVDLIRGNLLPSALLWITTRPAAANQIPAKYVSMVTEVRGFTDEQKEQYFRKRFTDQQQATDIISHIKTSRSLFIMCHIPVFCWILFKVLLDVMETRATGGLPTTLTQMYVHFLVVQAKGKDKTDSPWTEETMKMVRSLRKLAFEQLQKGNLIFSESNLREYELEAEEITHSGVFTQVFREKPGQGKNKVYCFIHLSVQEFLAALHVHQTFFSSGQNLLSPPQSSDPETFYRSAVDQALQSPNGHLDLFLRFLLGLSLPTNQTLLQGLLTQTGSELTNQETVEYIRDKMNERGMPTEKNLNLLHCLNELNDHSLLEYIQMVIRKGRLSDQHMSPADWSALSYILLSSDSDLENFDLKKYHPSEKGLLRLLMVVKASTKANLSGCLLTKDICGPLASVLSSSSLTQLDLSNNDLQDSGVELLCEGLKSAPCRLQTLRLSGCMVSERGGASLASALSSAPSHLRELDLSYNHPGSSTELLKDLQAPQGPLDSLRLDPAAERFLVPGLRKYACQFSLDPDTVHEDLLLSEDHLSVTREERKQQYPDLEDRFTGWSQVLSSRGMRGRCYLEVDWRMKRSGWVVIAMSYRGITRRGEECVFGDNDQSWSLTVGGKGDFSVHHNSKRRDLRGRVDVSSGRGGVSSGRVAMFLDWEGGALSFYDVSDGGNSHIFTFHSSFTEDLFPGFGLLSLGSSVTMVLNQD